MTRAASLTTRRCMRRERNSGGSGHDLMANETPKSAPRCTCARSPPRWLINSMLRASVSKCGKSILKAGSSVRARPVDAEWLSGASEPSSVLSVAFRCTVRLGTGAPGLALLSNASSTPSDE